MVNGRIVPVWPAADVVVTRSGLEAVLHRQKLRVNALRDAVETGPDNTDTSATEPAVHAELLIVVAAAIRDHQEIRFHYRGDQRLQVEPYRLVTWQRRWYLVARDASTDAWSSFRPDWMQLRVPGGRYAEAVEGGR